MQQGGAPAKNVLGSREYRRYWRNGMRQHAPHVTRAEQSRRRSVRLSAYSGEVGTGSPTTICANKRLRCV